MSDIATGNGEELLECDLVMKGGITSGIVYPPAVLELCRRYRFRSIGGASAGAIAAAVTASAEYAREKGGFERLKETNRWLGDGTNLLDLFQPSEKTRPLLTALLAVIRFHGETEQSQKKRLLEQKVRKGTGRLSWVRAIFGFAPRALRKALPGQYWLLAAIGAIAGMALGTVLVRGIAPSLGLVGPLPLGVGILLGYVTGWLVALLGCLTILILILFRKVPETGYGVCTGRRGVSERKNAPALTDWLHETINDLAGLDKNGPPLTLGQLASKDPAIQLRMVTTNVTLGEPVVVPLEDFYLAKEKDLLRLFPEPVVRHLRDRARSSRRVELDPTAFAGYFFLPPAEDFPVVFAARLSLSFPVLLSAVPLYAIKRSAYAGRRQDGVVRLVSPGEDLDCHWFSDGGISSNFPIHFFDTWFPTRPTFGINLTSLSAEVFEGGELAIPSENPDSRMRLKPECQAASAISEEEDAVPDATGSGPADPADAVFLPRPNTPQYAPVTPIRDLFGFLGAIWTTAQNFRDNMQARLPSYRERIVQIRFAQDEGGLNLAMGPKEIQSITAKGKLAGERLRDQFSMPDHRWVRLRVLLAELEANLSQGRRAFPSADAYRAFLAGLREGAPYGGDPAWRGRACEYLTALSEMTEIWERIHGEWAQDVDRRGASGFFSRGAPRPPASLRVTPRV
jgi:predicted acylesterase/phospholipase RssA